MIRPESPLQSADSTATFQLNQAMRLAANGRWNEADQLADELLKRDHHGRLRLAWAQFLVERENWPAATGQLVLLRERAADLANRELDAGTHKLLAIVYRRFGQWELANRFQQRALSQLNDCGPDELVAMAQHAIAERLWRVAETLLEVSRQLQPDEVETGTETALSAIIAEHRGDDRTALQLLLSARRLHRQAGDEVHLAADNVNLANIFGRMGRRRTELRLLARARATYRRNGLKWSEAIAARHASFASESALAQSAAPWN